MNIELTAKVLHKTGTGDAIAKSESYKELEIFDFSYKKKNTHTTSEFSKLAHTTHRLKLDC